MTNITRNKSLVDPAYSGGGYFSNPERHSEDAQFKAKNFLNLFVPLSRNHRWGVNSYVDVGCGSGKVVKLVMDGLRKEGIDLDNVKGYDVSPHVEELSNESVQYVCGDFCSSNEFVDLVTLFDVFEHVASPLDFIRNIAERTKIIALHIPLDKTLQNNLRDRYRSLLRKPGHLLFMDSVFALNICTLAGLRVVDYEYTFGFYSPSGHRSILSKIVFPIRLLLSKLSPWALSKTFGGTSLLVIAITPNGMKYNNDLMV